MTIERGSPEMTRLLRLQLLSLGFPLAPDTPAGRPEDLPLDGRTIKYEDEADNESFLRFLGHIQAAKGDLFVVVVDLKEAFDKAEANLMSGHTIYAVGAEVIRYQPVLVERRFMRRQGLCKDGVIFEFDADRVHAWDGRHAMRGAGSAEG